MIRILRAFDKYVNSVLKMQEVSKKGINSEEDLEKYLEAYEEMKQALLEYLEESKPLSTLIRASIEGNEELKDIAARDLAVNTVKDLIKEGCKECKNL